MIRQHLLTRITKQKSPTHLVYSYNNFFFQFTFQKFQLLTEETVQETRIILGIELMGYYIRTFLICLLAIRPLGSCSPAEPEVSRRSIASSVSGSEGNPESLADSSDDPNSPTRNDPGPTENDDEIVLPIAVGLLAQVDLSNFNRGTNLTPMLNLYDPGDPNSVLDAVLDDIDRNGQNNGAQDILTQLGVQNLPLVYSFIFRVSDVMKIFSEDGFFKRQDVDGKTNGEERQFQITKQATKANQEPEFVEIYHLQGNDRLLNGKETFQYGVDIYTRATATDAQVQAASAYHVIHIRFSKHPQDPENHLIMAATTFFQHAGNWHLAVINKYDSVTGAVSIANLDTITEPVEEFNITQVPILTEFPRLETEFSQAIPPEYL